MSSRVAGLIGLAVASALATSQVSCGGGGSTKKGPLTLEQIVNADPLPMAKGSRWTYDVTIKRYDPSADKEVEQELRWTTEVTDAKENLGLTAYTIRGWLSDLADFEGTPKQTERVLLRSGNQFLWAAGTEPTADGAEGWFSWPIIDGQKICPSAETVYCWIVSSVDAGYRLSYYTGPDEEAFDLEIGTGVSKYHYKHHGTLNEVEAKLTGYSPGKK